MRQRCAAQAESVCESCCSRSRTGSWLPRGWMDGKAAAGCRQGLTCTKHLWIHTLAHISHSIRNRVWNNLNPSGFWAFPSVLPSPAALSHGYPCAGQMRDTKVNLGLFLSAGFYETIWNMAELSLLFTFPKCNLLLISSVSKVFWMTCQAEL